MSKIWYGYLEEKDGNGSYVVYDEELIPPSQDLVYLFHYNRNKFVLYKKDIVRPKLRSVRDSEDHVIDQVDLAYRMAEYFFTKNIKYGWIDDIMIESRPYTSIDYFTNDASEDNPREVWKEIESPKRSD